MNKFVATYVYLTKLAGGKAVPYEAKLIERVLARAVNTLSGKCVDGELPEPNYTMEPAGHVVATDYGDGEEHFDDFYQMRSKELDSATRTYLAQLAGKELAWSAIPADNIWKVRDAGAIALSYMGLPICNPCYIGNNPAPCYRADYGSGCPVPDWECPMLQKEAKGQDFTQHETIVVQGGTAGKESCMIIRVLCGPHISPTYALRNAVKEYCESPAWKTLAAARRCDAFNYYDLEKLPQNICKKHGFYIKEKFFSDIIVPCHERLND